MEPINDMSIFIKRSAAGSNLYPPRIACYVCGAEVPSDYPLFPEPSPPSPPPPSLASITAIMSKPHFPFLMHHPPPLGCRPPSPGGVAKSCRVCYSALMRQWDDFERTGVPTDRRVYWLRRNDGLSFASPEVQVQAASEVKSRILGQFQHHPRSQFEASSDIFRNFFSSLVLEKNRSNYDVYFKGFLHFGRENYIH